MIPIFVPSALGSRVTGIVLTHTTPTNPVRTTSGAAFYTAIEKPVLMPLMYLTIALSPLVWLMNWLGYLNGSAHLATKLSSFGGTETWEEIDFFTRFQRLCPSSTRWFCPCRTAPQSLTCFHDCSVLRLPSLAAWPRTCSCARLPERPQRGSPTNYQARAPHGRKRNHPRRFRTHPVRLREPRAVVQ